LESSSPTPDEELTVEPPDAGVPPSVTDTGAAPHPSRDELAQASLTPLAPGERPTPLLVAVAVAALLALTVIIGALTIHGLSRHGGSLPGGVFLACVLALLALGMYQRRYWAVLSFEGLLAFQILVTSLALVVASTLLAAGLCLISIVLAGWLFWKLVRVMGRIQAGERP
jgi:multisubunit Na+/H+ antiporter MnhB subunit